MSLDIITELCCDFCSEAIYLDFEVLPELWVALQEQGWTGDENTHYCPECSQTKKNIQVQKIIKNRLN